MDHITKHIFISIEEPSWADPSVVVLRAARLLPELSAAVHTYAASQNKTPETIIAEAVRAYLGADQ